jgi:enoyl-CoA hydratase/carnithine racemase
MADDVFVLGGYEQEVFVTVERRDDGVALVRLDRPKINALSGGVLQQIRGAVEQLEKDPPGAVVVWGGERIFSGGADITEFGATGSANMVAANFHAALGALAGFARATIAAVNGYALGGGLELALACDLRVAADNARLGTPEVQLGVLPGGGGTQRLARLLGPSRAKDLVLTGRPVPADEALAMGLVNRVVPAASVLDAALELAGTLAKGAPVAQSLAKSAIDRGLEGTLEEGLAIERQAFIAASASEDAQRGFTSFREQGPGRATFVGR